MRHHRLDFGDFPVDNLQPAGEQNRRAVLLEHGVNGRDALLRIDEVQPI